MSKKDVKSISDIQLDKVEALEVKEISAGEYVLPNNEHKSTGSKDKRFLLKELEEETPLVLSDSPLDMDKLLEKVTPEVVVQVFEESVLYDVDEKGNVAKKKELADDEEDLDKATPFKHSFTKEATPKENSETLDEHFRRIIREEVDGVITNKFSKIIEALKECL